MTVTQPTGAASGAEVPAGEDLVSLSVDGFPIQVPKGTLVIRAAELAGIQVPRFCDHPLLEPVGACRQCLVEIATPNPRAGGEVQKMPKPQASCTITVSEGMVVETQHTSPVADKAQQSMMEFLLVNHPLDCPVCDKGGECPLQNQAMSNGRPEARFDGRKRTYPKPIAISAEVLLDRERCVLCARCTRFSQEIAGDPFIELLERGALQQVGIYEKEPFESYFSGNTIQICPVGALTSTAYRFRARPFDLVSVPTACEHCASGCALRTDVRRGKVQRRLAGDDPEVNEEWSCDKGRFAFSYATQPDRLQQPLVRDADTGELVTASWPEALDTAARGLAAARDAGKGVGVLTGGRVTVEDAYAYAKFARVALATNDVDFRARATSAEETSFLAARVAGTGRTVTYADLERAPAVLLAGFEAEEESPILFLRLRKAARKAGLRVWSVAPFASRGLAKLAGTLVPAAPGTEGEVLDAVRAGDERVGELAAALRGSGAVVLVGERLATSSGALTAAAALADATGARLAWVPRRAGERGALEAGAFPSLLPGGRPVGDAAARVDVGTAWASGSLPGLPGRDTAGILAAAAAGELDALVVGGVDPDDLPDPARARDALETAGFVVSLELRTGAVTERADVVLPVAPVAEKSGTFLDWEGRARGFSEVLPDSPAMSDARVLTAVADAMGVDLGVASAQAARTELVELGPWDGARATLEPTSAAAAPQVGPGEAVLATWRELLDGGSLLDGEPHLAATARRAVLRLSATTAAESGAQDGELVALGGPAGEITLPLEVTDMPDGVAWVPARVAGAGVPGSLGAGPGDIVRVQRGGRP